MDNVGFEEPDLPGTSEIIVHNGRIAMEGAQQHASPFGMAIHGHAPAAAAATTVTAAAAAAPPPPSHPRLSIGNGVPSTGKVRIESVVYAQKGGAEVTYINIKTTSDGDAREGGGDSQGVRPDQDSSQSRQVSIQSHQDSSPNHQGSTQNHQVSTQNHQDSSRNRQDSIPNHQNSNRNRQDSNRNHQGSNGNPASSVVLTEATMVGIGEKIRKFEDRNTRATNMTRTRVNTTDVNQSSSSGNAVTRIRVGGSSSQSPKLQYIDAANRQPSSTDNTYTPLPSVTKINVRTFNNKSYGNLRPQSQSPFEAQRTQRTGNGTVAHEENGELKSVPDSDQKAGGPDGAGLMEELQNVIRNREQHRKGAGHLEHQRRRLSANTDDAHVFPSISCEYDVVGGDKSSFDGYDRIGSVAACRERYEQDVEHAKPRSALRTGVGIYSEIGNVNSLAGRRLAQTADVGIRGDSKVADESNEYETLRHVAGGLVERLLVPIDGNVEDSDIKLVLNGLQDEGTHSNHKRNKYTATNPHPRRGLKDGVGLCRTPDNTDDTKHGRDRLSVLGEGGVGRISAMERVKSWVVSQDDADEITGKDSSVVFDRHSIAEMPIKMASEASHQELKAAEDAVFNDVQQAEDVAGHPRAGITSREHVYVEAEGNAACRVHISLDPDTTETFAGNHSIDGILSDQVISDEIAIEMAEMDSDYADGRFPRSTMQHPDGNTFDRSFLAGWTPSSPYAHHLQRNPSALSEGSQPHATGKGGKVRQLSLAIGEEWEDMTGHTPVVSPTVDRAFRSHRRVRSWESDGHHFFGRNFRYMSHPPRLESYYRRNRHPEDQHDDAVVTPPSPTSTAMEEEIPEEKRQTPDEEVDQEKRWLKPNPYNNINQRFHSTLQCPCCLFFCFLCCLPAVYFMQESDKEFDYGSKDKARKLGRKATMLYVFGSICSIIFLTTTVSLVVIYLQAYLLRK